MVTAAIASAASFFVITKSGIAGTLMGAAVFSAVYSGASHWVGTLVERGASWWLGRRGVEVIDPDREDAAVASDDDATIDLTAPEDGAARRRFDRPRLKRLALTWAPLLLAVAAIGASGYSLATGTPIERVIIRERVVEKPVVQEKVVVQKETVTVTVTVPSDTPLGHPTTPTSTTTSVPGAGATTTSTTESGSATTSTTVTTSPPPPSTTTTTNPGG